MAAMLHSSRIGQKWIVLSTCVGPVCTKYFRLSSSDSIVPHGRYADTVNLPRTDFPLSMKDGAVVKRELEIQKVCGFDELYEWQWKEREHHKLFVLHDGPPYANGDPHVGHALNKILKDITNRYKLLRGYRVHYRPGWDCHGLPIEQKALAEARMDHRHMDPFEIRKKAEHYARSAALVQMSAFWRWGVMADWKNGCYFTMDRQYEADQLELFYNMLEKKCIHQDYMPVFWSPSSRTALAEAEIEYNDQFQSTAIYVKFPLCRLPAVIANQIADIQKTYVVIWTTTPWTIPLNQAVCFGANIQYGLLKDISDHSAYIVSTAFKEKFETILGRGPLQILCSFDGSALADSKYINPAVSLEREMPLLAASHVTVAKGTGLVHTAPAHGSEDFQVAIKSGLPLDCHVDEDGLYMEGAGVRLVGKSVLSDGSKVAMEMLAEQIVGQEQFVHSYPHDWRTKQPLIIRASKQWFVDTGRLKDKALACLDGVQIRPRGSSAGMFSQLAMRTYWCISRQRVWGIPIPVFYRTDTKEPLISRPIVDHLKNLVAEKGAGCWWTSPIEELLPLKLISQSGCDPSASYERGKDVLDIWFDSGISWYNVLKDCGNVADVYLEGVDQFGGWFQSSLLTSVAVQDKAPYRNLVVHGFALDEEGKKMSKSLGNVVDPLTVIDGGKNRKKEPAFGVDVLRLWAAHSGSDIKIHIGPTILAGCHEQLFKLRKSLRYLISNLHDFDRRRDLVNYRELLQTDQYMLHLLFEYISNVTSAYEEFNYSRALNLADRFNSVHISGFHTHISKDRSYCGQPIERRSCQSVQYAVLDAMTKTLAPIVPHFSEEICQYHPLRSDYASIFKSHWAETDDCWNNLELAERFHSALSVQRIFNSLTAADRPRDFDVTIVCPTPLYKVLKTLHKVYESRTGDYSTLQELLQCATVSLVEQHTLPSESDPCDIGMAKIARSTVTVTFPAPVEGVSTGSATNPRSNIVCEFAVHARPTSRRACQRCRRRTIQTEIIAADSSECLCDRCTDIVRNIRQSPPIEARLHELTK